MLAHAGGFPLEGVEDADGIAFRGPFHVVALPVAGVGLVQGKHSPFPQGEPFHRAALAGSGLPGELPIADHLGG